MWIHRFHKLQTKDYNKLARLCKRHGFIPKKIPPVVLCKAFILHESQRVSWRALGEKFQVSHIALYNFYEFVKQRELKSEIFHVFIDARISLYIDSKRMVSSHELDNSEDLIHLTKRQLQSMLGEL